jgi:hypothetical protein
MRKALTFKATRKAARKAAREANKIKKSKKAQCDAADDTNAVVFIEATAAAWRGVAALLHWVRIG